MRVVFYEAFEEEAEALRHALAASPIADRVHAEYRWQTIQEAHPEGTGDTPPAPVISVRTQSDLPDAWAPHLDAIVTRSTGYDHILDYRARTATNVPAGYLPLYCNTAVAEQALLMWMMLLRKANRQQQQFPAFHRDGITGLECLGKRLLVVGVGNIGSEIVRIGQGLGMLVQGHDLVKAHDTLEYVDDIDAAIPHADVIACAMDHTPDNTGYFSYQRLANAKHGAIFVNVSRGELSPSTALLQLLNEGRLGGVGLDVFDREKPLAAHLRDSQPLDTLGDDATRDEVNAALALAKRTDTVITPHNAFNTDEAVQRKAGHAIVQLETLLNTNTLEWPVP